MSYKCRVCGSNEVDHPGDICEICAIGADPYASNISGTKNSTEDDSISAPQISGSSTGRSGRKVLINGGNSVFDQDTDGDDIVPDTEDDSVQVYSPGQVPQGATVTNNSTNTATAVTPLFVTSGITKNINVDIQERTFLTKWFEALFKKIPFTFDNDITMFQVFPDFSGTALNSMGNACDQVIFYGKINNGTISENNEVEVYGHRDSGNNVIATKVRNKASGTIITPMRCISTGVVWAITALVAALALALILGLGVEGVIWVAVALLCLTNMPLVIKVLGVIIGIIFSSFKRRF